jgi:hypothetical protein
LPAAGKAFILLKSEMSTDSDGTKRREDAISPQNSYRSYLISRDSLDIDDLLFRCLGFVCNKTFAMDQSDIEMIAALERRMADIVYYDDPKKNRNRRMELLTKNVFSILERISPEDCFFGIHPGDPGRLGFWPESLRFRS